MNTTVGCHSLLHGNFPTQGSNPGLPHCRQILYCLSHQKDPSCFHGRSLLQGAVVWFGPSLLPLHARPSGVALSPGLSLRALANICHLWFTVCSLTILGTPESGVIAAQSCLSPCHPMDCSTPGFPVLHYLPELAQTHVH